MGFFNVIWVWLKQIIMLPANLAKIARIDENLKLQQQLSEMQQRLEKAEKCLAKDAAIKSGRMFFGNNVYWAKDAEGEIESSPYCPRCFELDGKAIHLVSRWKQGRDEGKCPECKADEIVFWKPN